MPIKSISFFIALRYLRQSTNETAVGTMVRLCFLSIALGTFSLALITAIMEGFEVAIHEKMKSIHPQCMIRKGTESLHYPRIKQLITAQFPEVAVLTPVMIEHAIIKSNHDDSPFVVLLQGVDPCEQAQVTALEQKLVPIEGKKPALSAIIKDESICIGKQLAQSLHVRIGDTVQLYYFPDTQIGGKKVTLSCQKATIGGLFDTGIEDFDHASIFASRSFTKSLFPDSGIAAIYLKVKPETDMPALIKRMTQRMHLDIVTWEELYPALVSALKLEKYAMFFILTLIILVASMNMIALLFMQITQKRGDIAIMKAMGMADASIAKIFMWLSLTITITATIIGLMGATLASYLLEQYPFIELPDAYYVSHLPAKMNWSILLITFIAVMTLSMVATWIPIRRIGTIATANVLRFEG